MADQKQTILLLPHLKASCDVKGDAAGAWNLQPYKAFQDVATSLDYEAPGEVNKISSVPTMWARCLTLEMVLYDKRHPLRWAMMKQWQGMLAALALAELRSFPLTAQLVELGQYKRGFGKSLLDLLPDSTGRNLYTLNNKDPWEDVYVFLWDNKPVGMSSPSTLVVPSEGGSWGDLPWWDRAAKRLEAPQAKLNAEEQGLLWGWLKNLSDEVNNHDGHGDAINIIQELIAEFQNSLTETGEKTVNLSDDPQFFRVPINRGALSGLNHPVKAPPQPSSVKLIASARKEGERLPLLLYDPAMPGVWGKEPQNIWIHGGKTLASLKEEDLGEFKTKWNKEVIVVKPDDLFLEDLYFIDLENALPGGFLPDLTGNSSIIFKKKRVTPLIPLNPILLDYFTPEDLLSKIKFQILKIDWGVKVRLMMNLPLTGVQDKDKKGKRIPFTNYQLYKDYDLKEENLLSDQLPVLEIWPNFVAKGWQEYYGFFYDAELGESTFQVSFPKARYAHSFRQGMGNYQMVRMESFPECIHCLDSDKNPIGLILLKPPVEVQLSKRWSVGVDFGTSFTNIYVNKKDVPEQLVMENLLHQVTASDPETRLNVLFEYFLPEDFIPKDKPLPLSSVLTTRGRNEKNGKMLPILDGRIYVPDSRRFDPQEQWIKTDLKWLPENVPYLQLFIRDLALYIIALAAKDGVKEIQWSLSYPSAFSRRDRNRYANIWQDLTVELEKKTGIIQNYPQIGSDNLRTESLAGAQYFADFEEHNLVYTTCIDLGGGTSDISIWEDNELLHQCSVQLAGKDIFSQFLANNPKLIQDCLKIDLSKWKGLKGGAFNARLDVWLRLESDNWLESKRTVLQDDPALRGLVRLTAIGIAGLYYYVGILLKVLHSEGKYRQGKITPVYIGGNGSRFLKWLDNRGIFDRDSEMNELLSRMLSAGSEFVDTEQLTRLSQNPKHEAACGLVLQGKKLKGMGDKAKDDLIAGEACEIKVRNQMNGQERIEKINAGSRLSVESQPESDEDLDVIDFNVPELVELPKFLYEFHKALKALEIEEITPLPGYVRSPERDQNSKLWENTQRELNDILLKLKEDASKGNEDKVSEKIRWEPPFILGLKALLRVLGKEWAGK